MKPDLRVLKSLSRLKPACLLLAVLAGGYQAPASATEADDYVKMPGVTEGEREIDFKYGSIRQSDGSLKQAASIGYGYGITDRWFAEAYVRYTKSTGDTRQFDAWEIETKYLLTEQGKYPFDVALVGELEITKAKDDPNSFRFGPLIQTEIGRFQLNGNVLFGRKFNDGNPHTTEKDYQWQVKYRWKPALEFGFQGFGEFGSRDAADEGDAHGDRWGPAVFGKVSLGGHQAIVYNAAWLIGTAPAAGHTLRLQMEYEF